MASNVCRLVRGQLRDRRCPDRLARLPSTDEVVHGSAGTLVTLDADLHVAGDMTDRILDAETRSRMGLLDDAPLAQRARARVIRGVRRYREERDLSGRDALATAAEVSDNVLLAVQGIGPGALTWLRQACDPDASDDGFAVAPDEAGPLTRADHDPGETAESLVHSDGIQDNVASVRRWPHMAGPNARAMEERRCSREGVLGSSGR